MAKTGKKKLFHNKNDKQKFKGQKRKRFERDIRPKKKRKMEGSQDKVLTKKQLKKKYFSERQYQQKEFEAKKITDEGVLRKMDDENEEEAGNPYKEFINLFGVKRNVAEACDDDGNKKEEEKYEEEDDIEDQDDDSDDDDDNMDEANLSEIDEEVEEGIDDDDDEDVESEDDDQIVAITDPYKEHFGHTLDIKVAASLLKPFKWNMEKMQVPLFGEATVMYPPILAAPSFQFEDVDLKKSCVKNYIINQFKTLPQKFPTFSPTSKSGCMSEIQENLFPIINGYADLYFPSRTFNNGDDLMFLYCLHALNHVTKIRNIVIKNNTKIKEKIEKLKKKKKKNKDDGDDDRDIQDQGYARPKVLIVVPFRSCVLKIVDIFIHLLQKADSSEKTMVSKKIRFMEEFGPPDEELKRGLKPDDFEQTFVGNTDENFKIGISIAKKTLKLYNEFYSSDIIIASPLGLKEVVEPEEKGKKMAGDHMFLSSIEVLILDQSDVLLMQNWNNVVTVLNHLNKQPDGKFAADIARIKDWYINGWQSLYRQTLIFSSFQTPEINGVFQNFASNYKGKCIIAPTISKPTMCNILSSLPQTFRRFTTKSIEDAAEARFQFFIKRVLPAFRNSSEEHVIIFIPSYYDFIRIRKYMKKEELEFEEICEYTQKERVSRARQFFFEGRMKYLLYTERFHFYYRYFIRGIHHLIFYDLPVNAQFYPELCNMVVDYKKEIVPVNTSCTAMYSRYDVQKLVRITGSERTNTLITSDEDSFSFASVDS